MDAPVGLGVSPLERDMGPLRRSPLLAACTVLTLACATDAGRPPMVGGEGSLRANADALDWQEVADSPEEQVVILAGDPNAHGEYTLRRRFPTGHQTPPHWHPHAEYGTVLEGVLYVGFGEEFDWNELEPIRAGGFIRLPPYTAHYTYAAEPVVLQVHGPGPRVTYYVHERPVPRSR
jgi:quercetin dioxygenase-like cupin family protein